MKKHVSIHGSTLFLRLALIGLAGLVSLLSVVTFWSAYANWAPEFPEVSWVRIPIMIGVALALLSFYVAACQAWKLLNFVDTKRPFSHASINALKNIKYAAFVIGGVLVVAMPLIYWVAEKDDAPGLIIFGAALAGIPLTVGVFAGVLQQLIQKAVDLKSENDLTV